LAQAPAAAGIVFTSRAMALRVLPAPPGGSHAHVVQVAVGKDHGLLLTDEGIVYSWSGKGEDGVLGRPHTTGEDDKKRCCAPGPVEKLKPSIIVQIACGKKHCLALTNEGKLWSWGCNTAGQLGIGPKDAKKAVKEIETSQRTPCLVKFPNVEGQLVKSCSCGPESSACVTISGDVYVWGALSHYLVSPQYKDEENCTVPVKLGQLPHLRKKEKYFCPDQVSVCREQIALTVAPKKIQDDLEDLRSLMKLRSSQIIAAAVSLRNRGKDNGQRNRTSDGVFESNDSKELLAEFVAQKRELDERVERLAEKLKEVKEEIERIRREITVCDQKETALSDEKASLELGGAEGRDLGTRLRDLENFKLSTKQQKFKLLELRDVKERENLKLREQFSDAVQQRSQADARSKLLDTLIEGKLSGKSAASSESVKVADSKLQELADTHPQKLAGVGRERFTGFREVLAISDRALQDVSRALREVTGGDGANEGDAAVLEEVLEANLKLRKEVNAHIQAKLNEVDGKGTATSEPSGMSKYFFEAADPNTDGGLAAKRNEDRAPRIQQGWGNW